MSDNQSLDALLEQAREPHKPPPSVPGRSGGNKRVLLLAIVLSLVTAGAGVFFLMSGFGGGMKNTEVAQEAIRRATTDPRVVEALGEPVEVKNLVNGEYSTGGLSGEADLTFRIEGSRERGRLYVGARRENGVWTYYTLAVEVISTGEVITLTE